MNGWDCTKWDIDKCPKCWYIIRNIQYIPINMHTVFALLCFVVVIHWLIFPYPSGLLHWHCGNLTIAPVPAKQPWWIWINTSYEFIMNDCITTTKQSTTKPCAYFLGYTVSVNEQSICYQSLQVYETDAILQTTFPIVFSQKNISTEICSYLSHSKIHIGPENGLANPIPDLSMVHVTSIFASPGLNELMRCWRM